MIFPWSDWIAHSWEADDRVKVHAHYVTGLTRVPPCWCWYPSLAEEVFVRVFRCKATPFPPLPAVAFMRKCLCTVSIWGVGSHALPHWEQTMGLHYPVLFRRERCLFLSDSLSCVRTRLVSVDFDLYCELDWPHLPPGRWMVSELVPASLCPLLSLWGLSCFSCWAHLIFLVSDPSIFPTRVLKPAMSPRSLIAVTGEWY